MNKISLSFCSLLLFVAFTNAVNIATNYGLCAHYADQKIGMPVTFIRCNPETIRQSTWQVVLVNAANAAGPRLFCINSEENLCIGINTATGVGQLVNKNTADPAQQFTPLTPGKLSRFTNGLWGTNNCASVRGSLMIMRKCDPTAPHQQLFVYGPDSRLAPGHNFDEDLDLEFNPYQQFGSYHPVTGNKFSYPYPYPYQFLHY